jgi:hypothetical protein
VLDKTPTRPARANLARLRTVAYRMLGTPRPKLFRIWCWALRVGRDAGAKPPLYVLLRRGIVLPQVAQRRQTREEEVRARFNGDESRQRLCAQ